MSKKIKEYNFNDKHTVKLNKWENNNPNASILIEKKNNIDFLTKLAYVGIKIAEQNIKNNERNLDIVLKWEDFEKVGIRAKQSKKHYETLIKEAFSILIKIKKIDESTTYYPLFNKAKINDKGILLQIHNDIIDDYKILEKNYLSFPLKLLPKLKTNGTISLYNHLKSCLDINTNDTWKRNVSEKELRLFFDNETTLTSWDLFKRKKITPAVERINSYSDIEIIDIKKSRGKDIVTFTFRWNKKRKEEFSNIDDLSTIFDDIYYDDDIEYFLSTLEPKSYL